MNIQIMKFFSSLFVLNAIDFLKIKSKLNNVFIEPAKIKRGEMFRGEYEGENKIFIRPFTIPKEYEKIFQEITKIEEVKKDENAQRNPRVAISRKLPVSIDTNTPTENTENKNDDKNHDKNNENSNERKKEVNKQKIDTSSPLYQINELLLTLVQYYIAYLVLHKLIG